MAFAQHGTALMWRGGHETVLVEPCGTSSLRVRGTIWQGIRDDLPGVTAQVLKGGPEYQVFARESAGARSRTSEYGANYPKVSQAVWTAIQAAITGTASPAAALPQAQATIASIPQVRNG